MSNYTDYSHFQSGEVRDLKELIKKSINQSDLEQTNEAKGKQYIVKLPTGFDLYHFGLLQEKPGPGHDFVCSLSEILEGSYTVRAKKGFEGKDTIEILEYLTIEDLNLDYKIYVRHNNTYLNYNRRLVIEVLSQLPRSSVHNAAPHVRFLALPQDILDVKKTFESTKRQKEGAITYTNDVEAFIPLIKGIAEPVGQMMSFVDMDEWQRDIKYIEVVMTKMPLKHTPYWGYNNTFVSPILEIVFDNVEIGFTLPKIFGGKKIHIYTFENEKLVPVNDNNPTKTYCFSQQQWKKVSMQYDFDDKINKGSLPLCPIQIIAEDYQKGKVILNLSLNYKK